MDPETGALLNVNEHQTMTLHNPATGAQALVLFDADLIATPASVSQIVALDSSGRSELTLLETTLPLVSRHRRRRRAARGRLPRPARQEAAR